MNNRLLIAATLALCLSCMVVFGQEAEVKKVYKKNAVIINTGWSKFYDRNVYSYQQSYLFSITTFSYERYLNQKLMFAATYGRRFLPFGQAQGQEGAGFIEYNTPNVPTNFKPEGESQL